MYSWIIKTSIISLVLIYLVHHLYDFFIKNLTTPKVKDLVNQPHHKYEEMLKKMNNTDTSKVSKASVVSNNNNSESDDSMKLELKNFLSNELKKNSSVEYANQDTLQYSSF